MARPKPKYTPDEIALNFLTCAAAMMRGGQGFTPRQKRRIDRIKSSAQLRAEKAAEK